MKISYYNLRNINHLKLTEVSKTIYGTGTDCLKDCSTIQEFKREWCFTIIF